MGEKRAFHQLGLPAIAEHNLQMETKTPVEKRRLENEPEERKIKKPRLDHNMMMKSSSRLYFTKMILQSMPLFDLFPYIKHLSGLCPHMEEVIDKLIIAQKFYAIGSAFQINPNAFTSSNVKQRLGLPFCPRAFVIVEAYLPTFYTIFVIAGHNGQIHNDLTEHETLQNRFLEGNHVYTVPIVYFNQMVEETFLIPLKNFRVGIQPQKHVFHAVTIDQMQPKIFNSTHTLHLVYNENSTDLLAHRISQSTAQPFQYVGLNEFPNTFEKATTELMLGFYALWNERSMFFPHIAYWKRESSPSNMLTCNQQFITISRGIVFYKRIEDCYALLMSLQNQSTKGMLSIPREKVTPLPCNSKFWKLDESQIYVPEIEIVFTDWFFPHGEIPPLIQDIFREPIKPYTYVSRFGPRDPQPLITHHHGLPFFQPLCSTLSLGWSTLPFYKSYVSSGYFICLEHPRFPIFEVKHVFGSPKSTELIIIHNQKHYSIPLNYLEDLPFHSFPNYESAIEFRVHRLASLKSKLENISAGDVVTYRSVEKKKSKFSIDSAYLSTTMVIAVIETKTTPKYTPPKLDVMDWPGPEIMQPDPTPLKLMLLDGVQIDSSQIVEIHPNPSISGVCHQGIWIPSIHFSRFRIEVKHQKKQFGNLMLKEVATTPHDNIIGKSNCLIFQQKNLQTKYNFKDGCVAIPLNHLLYI